MSRISIPATIESTPAASHALLDAVQRQLGTVPNLFRLVAKSPSALEGYVSLIGALSKGNLPAPTRERIALAIAEVNRCSYCLSAHAYLGKNVAKLSDEEIARNRDGASDDPHAGAAVRFAVKVAQARGRVSENDVAELRAAGYDDAQLIEIVLHVALNTWTNYLNEVAQTDVDFPVVVSRKAA